MKGKKCVCYNTLANKSYFSLVPMRHLTRRLYMFMLRTKTIGRHNNAIVAAWVFMFIDQLKLPIQEYMLICGPVQLDQMDAITHQVIRSIKEAKPVWESFTPRIAVVDPKPGAALLITTSTDRAYLIVNVVDWPIYTQPRPWEN